jgi:hypothetical protein
MIILQLFITLSCYTATMFDVLTELCCFVATGKRKIRAEKTSTTAAVTSADTTITTHSAVKGSKRQRTDDANDASDDSDERYTGNTEQTMTALCLPHCK